MRVFNHTKHTTMRADYIADFQILDKLSHFIPPVLVSAIILHVISLRGGGDSGRDGLIGHISDNLKIS
jgi:hypothetical protein